MGKNSDISLILNYPQEEMDLKELEDRKISIVINILKEKYGHKLVEEYVGSIREKIGKYSGDSR